MHILVEKICHSYLHRYFCERWLTDIETVNKKQQQTFKKFLYLIF